MRRMVQYEPHVLYQNAERLYATARSMVIKYALIGAFLGGVLGGVIGSGFVTKSDTNGVEIVAVIALTGAVIIGVFGADFGREKGFFLRLEAQKILCQVKIEESVRWTAQNTPSLASTPPR